jgi:hypothetical protein
LTKVINQKFIQKHNNKKKLSLEFGYNSKGLMKGEPTTKGEIKLRKKKGSSRGGELEEAICLKIV